MQTFDALGIPNRTHLLHDILLELVKCVKRVHDGKTERKEKSKKDFLYNTDDILYDNDEQMLEEVFDLLDHICHLLYGGKRGEEGEKYRREFIELVGKIVDDSLRKKLLKMIV